MKKILILLLILSLLWIIKLSYDVFNVSAQQTELISSLHRIEQNNANLNDQLVALQRQVKVEAGTVAQGVQAEHDLKAIEASNIDPVVVIKQQLDLIEFMLKQQKLNEALDKLMNLDRNLEQYTLAPSLKQSLHQVIAKDQQVIQQFASDRVAQQTKVDGLIHQLDQALTQEINIPKLSSGQPQTKHFWQRWLVIEPAKQPAVALMQRPLILKEAQLRLLLAHQALQQGQYLEYQESLTEIIQLLHQIPDEKSRQLIQNIQKIKGFTVIPTPILNTRALLG
ncbi:hypothetical protein E0H89_05370 [Acinetobacter sp. ANC 3781]|uniref:hypothetical protein n=1 Tax=Acinetobacter sp. ANC 3781 TaxID=2529835 RepID=UPI00103F954F|nr:hypothetical protein [Acinetobacter sp. ANC 3781]TCB78677.1 hypothetical protein E0H89_05370 [Acinetobacter sp. ANC 3781]